MFRNFQKWAALCATAVIVLAAIVALAQSPTPAKQGRDMFEKRCTGCHDLDKIKVGPPLRHVFSHRSGEDPQFPYSEALKKAQIPWDAVNLDRWLLDPDAVVPDNDMTFRLNSAEERAAIISFLKQLAGK